MRLRLRGYLQLPLLSQQRFRFPALLQLLRSLCTLTEAVLVATANPLPEAYKARLGSMLDLSIQAIDAVMVLRSR